MKLTLWEPLSHQFKAALNCQHRLRHNTGTGDREPQRGRVGRERVAKVLQRHRLLPQGQDAQAQVGLMH